MDGFIDVDEKNRDDYNKVVSHPLQSYEWGEFRKKTGVKVIRRALVKDKKIIDGFCLTLHKVPKTKYYIGYLPKGNPPTPQILEEVKRIGLENKCIFIQLEPNMKAGTVLDVNKKYFRLQKAAHPLFTKYTFVLDMEKSETDLLANMHPKTRYNIRVAEKHKIKVKEDNSEAAFNDYLKLMLETTNRQGFYAHTPSYHKNLWEVLSKNQDQKSKNQLTYHLINASYHPVTTEESQDPTPNPQSLTLTSWVLFVFHDHLYYPYGASSRQHRETMSNNLVAWEAIKFGKRLGLKYFDMWGALGPEPDKNDPWYGFHRFKQGYGAELVEFVGSFDLVIKPAAYEIYKVADKARWAALRVRKMIG
ncbi:MAG TPA: peptidoglycan bridge formation glycyltransferase FemA/FemB family protein [Patescibacteria group bacterium]|nr:peptidoglycan bridge formation glycyltransferase FemA/FemB family protein [Patescibacteria group bacterium]